MANSHEPFISLVVRNIAGELLPQERQSLESHLEQCSDCSWSLQKLATAWQDLEILQLPDIPVELYNNVQNTLRSKLRRADSPLPWLGAIRLPYIWSLLLSIFAGLAMTGLSYLLIHNYGNPTIHHHEVLIPLFVLWWLLFAGVFWILFEGNRTALRIDWIAAWTIPITFLALILTFPAYEIDSFRSLGVSTSDALTIVSELLFGVGNAFVTQWGLHGCLASFLGASLIGFRNNRWLLNNVSIAAGVIAVLLLPAIYLQSSPHNHGLGIIAWAAFGVFIGSFAGMLFGFYLRRQLAYQLN